MNISPQKVVSKLKYMVKRNADLRYVAKAFTHVSGPKFQEVGDDEVVLLTVGYNVSSWIETFFEQHQRLGARHYLYVDNGSTDDSIAKAQKLPNMTVASCDVSFARYQRQIRMLSTRLYHRGGWRLMLDADEIFDYPNSNDIRLPQLTNMLTKRGYTGVVAQSLDMFPAGELANHFDDSLEQAIEAFRHYSLSGISTRDYHDPSGLVWFLKQNRITNSDIKLLFGGIRATAFGENCMLTKHPLVKMLPEVSPMLHPHISTGLRCADFSALIKHYKFSGGYQNREASQLSARSRSNIEELKARRVVLGQNPELKLCNEDSLSDPTPESLLEKGFLVASPAAREALGL